MGVSPSRVVVITPEAGAPDSAETLALSSAGNTSQAATAATLSLAQRTSMQFFSYTMSGTIDPPSHTCIASGVYWESSHPHAQYYYPCNDPSCPNGNHYVSYTGDNGYDSSCSICNPPQIGLSLHNFKQNFLMGSIGTERLCLSITKMDTPIHNVQVTATQIIVMGMIRVAVYYPDSVWDLRKNVGLMLRVRIQEQNMDPAHGLHLHRGLQ